MNPISLSNLISLTPPLFLIFFSTTTHPTQTSLGLQLFVYCLHDTLIKYTIFQVSSLSNLLLVLIFFSPQPHPIQTSLVSQLFVYYLHETLVKPTILLKSHLSLTHTSLGLKLFAYYLHNTSERHYPPLTPPLILIFFSSISILPKPLLDHSYLRIACMTLY